MEVVKNHLLFEHKFLKFSAVVNKAEGDLGKFMADFEKSLTRSLLKEWQARAELAVKAGLGKFDGKGSKAEARKIVNAVSEEMEKFGSEVGPDIEESVRIFYQEQVKRFLKKHKIKPIKKAALVEGEASLSLADQAAIKTIQKLTVQTAGRYFTDQVKTKVSEVVEEVIFKQGLETEEAAKVLEAELRGSLGTEKMLEGIPTRFHNNPANYFNTLAQNASVQSANVGRIIGMDEAGITKFEVVAIIDARTSSICRQMDGQVLEIATARATVDEFIALDSLEGLQKLMPFSTDGSSPAWVGKGAGFPPYHHKCRSTVIPVID